jgi:hypothetical protein
MSMKTLPCIVLGLFLLSPAAQSGEARYETVTGTNVITIADYESAELISVLNTNSSSGAASLYPTSIRANKNGYSFILRASAARFVNGNNDMVAVSSVGDVVRGPATFQLTSVSALSAHGFTLKITPVAFPPDQTLIVPPGTNQVHISMESSTNLVNWATATNGIYGSPNEARFFRLKMTNLQP